MNRVKLSVSALVMACTSMAFAQEGEAPAVADSPPVAAATPADECVSLFKKRGLKNFEAAVQKCEEALKADPGNKELMLNTADAINAVMRVKTAAATKPIEGGADSPRNKKIWRDMGARSLELAEKATGKKPKNLRESIVYAESYMYYSSSMGIIKAILEGAADQYKKNADAILKYGPSADGDVGDIYHGAFYMVAPWPMSDTGKAKTHFEKALKKAPKSARNNYWAGVRALKDEDWDTAEKHFKFVVDNRCTIPSERDYCSFLKKQAKIGLDKVKAER